MATTTETSTELPTVTLETVTHGPSLVNTIARFSDGLNLVFNGSRQIQVMACMEAVGYEVTEKTEEVVSKRELLDHGVGLTEAMPFARGFGAFMDKLNAQKKEFPNALPMSCVVSSKAPNAPLRNSKG